MKRIRLVLPLFLAVALPLAFYISAPTKALADGQWVLTGQMNFKHTSEPVILLQNGKALIAGGGGSGSGYNAGLTNTSELYDPSTGQWSYTGNMQVAVANANPLVLNDGRVLIEGGSISATANTPTTASELYDPSTGQWSYTGNLNVPHSGALAVKLLDGRILIISGWQSNFTTTSTSELYDPSTGQWTLTGSVHNPIFDGAANNGEAILLNDGRVLKVGGNIGSNSAIAELYDPATGQWTQTGSLLLARYSTKLIKLQDGRVLMIGGDQWGNIVAECEIYDPSTGQWAQTGSLNYARGYHDALMLPDGRVLVAGGSDIQGNFILQTEIYNPTTGTWIVDASLNTGHSVASLMMLSNGKVLVASGQQQTAELYTPNPFTITLPNATINESDTYSANGSFTDSSTSTSWTATVDYGDGGGAQPLTLSGMNFSLSHQYKDEGTYTVTIAVTNNQNTTGTGLAVVTVNNAPFTVGIISASSSPVLVNTAMTASANFTDPGVFDTHTASWNWGDGNTTTGTVIENNGSGSVSNSHTYTATGVYTIILTVTDDYGVSNVSAFQYISVYDTNTSFAGGTSFTNLLSASPNTTGKVKFGISAKYTGNNILTGSVKMDFKAANIDFVSTSLQSLATTNGRAYLRGTGTLNGVSGYTFLATGIDGSIAGGNDLIRFQIKDSSGNVVYDSQPGASDTTDPTTVDATGNIRVH